MVHAPQCGMIGRTETYSKNSARYTGSYERVEEGMRKA